MAVAPSGKVYVTNQNANTVSVIDPANGNTVTTISNAGFNSPRGVAVAADGKVYVANYAAGAGTSVFVIDPANGNAVRHRWTWRSLGRCGGSQRQGLRHQLHR